MRILFASTGGAGHFGPLVPWIEMSQQRGHEVLVVGPPALEETVRRAGYPFRRGATPPPEVVGPIWRQVATLPVKEAGPLVIGEIFCRLNSGAMLPVMRAACEEWAPELVLRDPTEFASAVAAREVGIRQVRIAHGLAAGEQQLLDMSGEALQSLRAGIEQDIAESAYVTLFPEVLDESAFPDTQRYRLSGGEAGSTGLPDWWPGNSDPLVYVTFGTVAPAMPNMVPVYRTALEALAELPIRVLLTVGRTLDPDEWGPQPANIRIERWVQQTAAMSQAAVVLCHGGAGTTLGALSAGVPMVVFPLFADQGDNGRCVAAAGAGIAVEARGDNASAAQRGFEPGDPLLLRDAVTRILADPAYHRSSARIATAIGELPPLDSTFDDVVGWTGRA